MLEGYSTSRLLNVHFQEDAGSENTTQGERSFVTISIVRDSTVTSRRVYLKELVQPAMIMR